MSKKEIVYVAGPFRAKTPWCIEQNIRKAEDAGLELAKLGYVPVIPHTMYRFFQDSLPDEFWLEAATEILLRCDSICMIGNWQESKGSCAELATAEGREMPAWRMSPMGVMRSLY